ncbi:hypothetical protein SpCBS45565_g03210 [Spizellomyces sp. 'palustris']|nr:hypothetical protein SpCBS45565_g03210 [Spizellomyces sp. 'palustris']
MSTQTTTYKGRLGYACLNTILRAQSPSIFCSRTCRLDTIRQNGIEHAYELGVQNARNIVPMLRWNEQHGIKFMRLSSEMFPFASHDVVGYSVRDVPGAVEALKEAGDEARRLGHRLTMHPGQFCQIASPRPVVVRNAIRELQYHSEILDTIGLGPDSVMIIHMGGVFGDKSGTIARFHENWKQIPKHIQDRIVLENDEICYSVQDLLPSCEQLGIPLVLDWHHDDILRSEKPAVEYLPRINAIWESRGIKPKQHYSESRKGAETPMQRRAHSDRVQRLPPCQDDVDLMIEAKDKEQAVLHLFRKFGLHPVPDGFPVSEAEQIELYKQAKRPRKTVTKIVLEAETMEGGSKARAKRKRKVKVQKKIEDDEDLKSVECGAAQVDPSLKRKSRKTIKQVAIVEETEPALPKKRRKIVDGLLPATSTTAPLAKGRMTRNSMRASMLEAITPTTALPAENGEEGVQRLGRHRKAT